MYNIIKNHNEVIMVCKNLKNARWHLQDIRKRYASDLPKGFKRLCRKHGEDAIIVFDKMNDGRVSGNEIIYAILEA